MEHCEICRRANIFHEGLCDQCDQMEQMLQDHLLGWLHDMRRIDPEHFTNMTAEHFVKQAGKFLAEHGTNG